MCWPRWPWVSVRSARSASSRSFAALTCPFCGSTSASAKRPRLPAALAGQLRHRLLVAHPAEHLAARVADQLVEPRLLVGQPEVVDPVLVREPVLRRALRRLRVLGVGGRARAAAPPPRSPAPAIRVLMRPPGGSATSTGGEAGSGGPGVVPQAEGHQRPQRTAEVLAAGEVALEQRRSPRPARTTPGGRRAPATAGRARTAPAGRAARPRPACRSPAWARARPPPEAATPRPRAARACLHRRARARGPAARSASSATTGSRNGTRTSRPCAMPARSAWGRRSSARNEPASTSCSRAIGSTPERLGVARPQRRERVAAPAEHRAPQRGAERLLERVVALERAEPGAERQPAQLEVQAQAPGGAREPRDRGRQRRRDARARRTEPVRGVGLVAAEQLIGALAGQHRLHLTGGEPRQQPVRERRRVARRLVVGRRDALELHAASGPSRIRGGRCRSARPRPAPGQLVERGDVEADAEGLHRRRRRAR